MLLPLADCGVCHMSISAAIVVSNCLKQLGWARVNVFIISGETG